MSVRVTSLRMPESMADELQAIARANGTPASEIIRAAIEREIDLHRADPGFQERRKKALEKDVAALDRLKPRGDERT